MTCTTCVLNLFFVHMEPFLLVWLCPFFHLFSHNSSFINIFFFETVSEKCVLKKCVLNFTSPFFDLIFYHRINPPPQAFIWEYPQCVCVLKSSHRSQRHTIYLLVSSTMSLSSYQNRQPAVKLHHPELLQLFSHVLFWAGTTLCCSAVLLWIKVAKITTCRVLLHSWRFHSDGECLGKVVFCYFYALASNVLF